MYQKDKKLIKNILIHESATIKDALKLLDKTAEKVLLVVDENNKLLGTLTDGDIRAYLLRGESLEHNVDVAYNIKNKSPFFIKTGDEKRAKKILVENKIELLPVLDSEHKVINYITWYDVVSEDESPAAKEEIQDKKLDIPVVIMAGGKGTRLAPFTRILPKPLIPVGDKPIVEIIIDEFKRFAIKKFYLTLNYKGELIESYFNGIDKDYEVEYVWEEEFLGTAGSLKLLEGAIDNDFIVSNCDVIVKADFHDVLKFHTEQNALLTVISAIQHYKIPYGVVKFETGGHVTDITEKPEYSFTINTGAYVINREALKFIPEKSHFDMPDLIKSLLKNDKKVLTYPVNEKEYIDIGQWKEYRKALEHFENIWGS